MMLMLIENKLKSRCGRNARQLNVVDAKACRVDHYWHVLVIKELTLAISVDGTIKSQVNLGNSDMPEQKTENKTFKGGEPSWLNACVGDNGSPQSIDYARGFATAANVLIDQAIAQNGKGLYVDELIYPICFNMRHAVELHLKNTVDHLEKLSVFRSPLPWFSAASSHDLGIIWEYIKTNSASLDSRFKLTIAALDQFVSDIAQIDSNGQVFRYPFDVENKKHLIEVSIISVVVLKQRFQMLERLLIELNNLGCELLEEYWWRSFTPSLSRHELFFLAADLPTRKEWVEPKFKETKSFIKKKYSIGSKEFCTALNIIQNNFEMAQLIERVPSLVHVDEKVLFAFFDAWGKLHDIGNVRNPPSFDEEAHFVAHPDFQKVQRWHLLRAECAAGASAVLNPSSLSSLKALFYLYEEMQYSESFNRTQSIYQKELDLEEAFNGSLLHLLSKTTALENILNSLNFLGQTELVSSLVERYDLRGCFSRILEKSNKRRAAILNLRK